MDIKDNTEADIIEEDTEVAVVEIDNSTKEDNLSLVDNNNSINNNNHQDNKYPNSFLKDLS